jgi:hypothetical protein
MPALDSLISNVSLGLGSIGIGQRTTNSNTHAIALIKAGSLPVVGATYTLIGAVETTVSGSTIASICKDLAYRNLAMFLPETYVNGTKADTVNLVDPEVWGNNSQASLTGEIEEMYTIVFKNFYQNRSGFNTLRKNSEKYDVVIFTNDSAELYYRNTHNVQLLNIKDAADGNSKNKRSGGFDISIRGTSGQVEPLFGVTIAQLADDVKFVFTEGTLTNLTAGTCSGDFKKYSRTTGGSISSIAFTVAPTISCVTYYLYQVVNGQNVLSTGSTYASISSTTGTVTFPILHVAGATKYIVVVENEVGVRGEYKLEVTI